MARTPRLNEAGQLPTPTPAPAPLSAGTSWRHTRSTPAAADTVEAPIQYPAAAGGGTMVLKLGSLGPTWAEQALRRIIT